MSKLSDKFPKIIIITTLLLLILPALLVAAPVFKDDFLCYDSTVGTNWVVLFPQASLGEHNMIIQVNLYDTLSSPWEKFLTNGYNLFDLNGSQLQPYEFLAPFQVDDSEMIAGALSIPHTNNNNFTLLPTKTYNNEQYIFIVDSTGQISQTPKCLNCDNPSIYNHSNWEAYGNINNNSKVGLVWYVSPLEFPPPGYEDSVFVRIYDFTTDSLSPLLNPLSLPLPEIDEPGYIGDYKTYNQPKIAIADDGSFVVVWVILGDDYSRVFHVVYNSDYTPRSQVQMADCFGTWADTANCTGVNANYIDVSMEPDGDFYITWSVFQSTPFADVRNHVWVRGFYSDGSPKYDPVRVNDSDSLWLLLGEELRPNVSCDDSGNVLISWTDARDYPGNYLWKPLNVYVQKIDPNGNLVGFNNRINNVNGAHRNFFHSSDLNNSGQTMIQWDYHPDSVNLPRVVAQLIPYNDIGTFIPGDVNYDRSSDISDLIAVVNYMFGGAINTFWPRSIIDFDGSGLHDIADLVYVVNYMFAGGSAPITPDEGIRPNPGKFNLGG